MSKKASSHTSKKFNYKTSQALPKIRKIKTNWDLPKHFYKSTSDKAIETDARKFERACENFIKNYKKKNFTSSSISLQKALKDYETLEKRAEASKIMRYFMFRLCLDVNDTAAAGQMSIYSDRFRKLSNELIFFSLKLGEIPVKKQRVYLTDKKLEKYHYFLKQAFQAAKYQLSEPEEKILNLRSQTSNGMWADAVEKVVSNRKITYRKKQINLPEALEIIDTLSWTEKGTLWNLILDELVQISEFAEHELTAIVKHEKVSDELRGYKMPYSGTVLSYENNEKSVEALVEAISTKGFELSRKFYKLKAGLHNKKQIPYVNKYDSIGKVIQPDYETAVEICRDVFYSIKNNYGEIFDHMLTQGQIDVYPKAGKRGGAFMANTVGLPTFVFLNHTNNFKSMETLAHEMGHAIHAERSKTQPEIYQDFSTTTAETASTLFEQLVLDKIYEQLSEEQRVPFLHDKICRDIATVQRQIACFNFELAMHMHIRERGVATKEELAKLMQKELKAYLGSAVEVTEKDGYSYVYWSHVRYGFYVYTYTYGHLVSNLIASKYQANNSYIKQIDEFLTAGSSDTVENIFKSIGINTLKTDTFLNSLDRQATEIKQLEKLTKKKKR